MHGLTYDPSTQAGCVLCRKDAARPTSVAPAVPGQMSPARRWFNRIGLLVILLCIGLLAECKMGCGSSRIRLGLWCGDRIGCPADHDCLDSPASDSHRCLKRCADDTECSPGHGCQDMPAGRHCLPVAPIGGQCGSKLGCPQNAACLVQNSGVPTCRERCDIRCPAGFVCAGVRGSPNGAPVGSYCVPRQ